GMGCAGRADSRRQPVISFEICRLQGLGRGLWWLRGQVYRLVADRLEILRASGRRETPHHVAMTRLPAIKASAAAPPPGDITYWRFGCTVKWLLALKL